MVVIARAVAITRSVRRRISAQFVSMSGKDKRTLRPFPDLVKKVTITCLVMDASSGGTKGSDPFVLSESKIRTTASARTGSGEMRSTSR